MINNNADLNTFKEAKILSVSHFKTIQSHLQSFLNLTTNTFQNFQEFKDISQKYSKYQLLLEKCARIITALERHKMKCAFFGRTSNGKSTVINALLGSKILPSGFGHTTNCFIQIQGTEEQNGYIIQKKVGDKEPIEIKYDASNQHFNKATCLPMNSVVELSHAFSKSKLNTDAIIYVFWPLTNCNLLNYDVCLLDSPGVDVHPDIDFWIDKYCLDADVFILVCNSESILTNSEKDFFRQVKRKLSSPRNIFILNNRWEICEEKEQESTKKQHYDRCIQFLSEDLEVMNPSQAQNHIFFISAKGILDIRDSSDTLSVKMHKMSSKEYLYSFKKFEKLLENDMCTSALRTKFYSHTEEGIELVMSLIKDIDEFSKFQNDQLREFAKSKIELSKWLSQLKSKFPHLANKQIKSLERALERLQKILMTHVQHQIKHIGGIIGEYRPGEFDNSTSTVLMNYKSDLNNYLEMQLNNRLIAVTNPQIREFIKNYKLTLIEEYQELLQLEFEKSVLDIINVNSCPEFGIPFASFFIDFQENLEFCWPLSPKVFLDRIIMIKKTFSHYRSEGVRKSSTEDISKPKSIVSSAINAPIFYQLKDTFITSHFLGLLGITAFITKTTGTRISYSVAFSYVALYAFAKYRWVFSTQENIFKEQLTHYASYQINNLTEVCCKNYIYSIQQELLLNHKTLTKITENERLNKEKDLQMKENQINLLTDYAKTSNDIKINAKMSLDNLTGFQKKYLRH